MLEDLRAEFERNGGWPVSVRELRGRLSSTSTIWMHLRVLENAGLVEGNGRKGWRPVG